MRKINPRILVAVIASLLDEIALVVMVVWVLPGFGITVPVWLIITLAIMFLFSGAWAFVVVKRRPNSGFENQIGSRGLAITTIGKKKGIVRIGRENWAARTEGQMIAPGTPIIVMDQNALILIVAAE